MTAGQAGEYGNSHWEIDLVSSLAVIIIISATSVIDQNGISQSTGPVGLNVGTVGREFQSISLCIISLHERDTKLSSLVIADVVVVVVVVVVVEEEEANEVGVGDGWKGTNTMREELSALLPLFVLFVLLFELLLLLLLLLVPLLDRRCSPCEPAIIALPEFIGEIPVDPEVVFNDDDDDDDDDIVVETFTTRGRR